MVTKKRIHSSLDDGIEKYVPRIHRLSSLAKAVMRNGDPQDVFFLFYTHIHIGF